MKQLYTHTPFWACRSIYLRTHPSIDPSTFVVVCTYPIALSVQLSSVHKAFAQGWPKTQPAGNPSEVPVTSHSSWAIWAWTLTWPSWRGHRSWTLWNPGSWSVWPVGSSQGLKLEPQKLLSGSEVVCMSIIFLDWQVKVSGFQQRCLSSNQDCLYGIWNLGFCKTSTDPGWRISLPPSKSKSFAKCWLLDCTDFELWCPGCCSWPS